MIFDFQRENFQTNDDNIDIIRCSPGLALWQTDIDSPAPFRSFLWSLTVLQPLRHPSYPPLCPLWPPPHPPPRPPRCGLSVSPAGLCEAGVQSWDCRRRAEKTWYSGRSSEGEMSVVSLGWSEAEAGREDWEAVWGREWGWGGDCSGERCRRRTGNSDSALESLKRVIFRNFSYSNLNVGRYLWSWWEDMTSKWFWLSVSRTGRAACAGRSSGGRPGSSPADWRTARPSCGPCWGTAAGWSTAGWGSPLSAPPGTDQRPPPPELDFEWRPPAPPCAASALPFPPPDSRKFLSKFVAFDGDSGHICRFSEPRPWWLP